MDMLPIRNVNPLLEKMDLPVGLVGMGMLGPHNQGRVLGPPPIQFEHEVGGPAQASQFPCAGAVAQLRLRAEATEHPEEEWAEISIVAGSRSTEGRRTTRA